MRAALAPLAAAVLAAAFLSTSAASAFERQWHAGASLGYLGGWSGVGHGAAGGLDLGYGVRDWLDIVGAIDVSYHPSSKLLVPAGTVGVRFTFDLLQVVPYVGVQVGAAGTALVGSGCTGGCSEAKLDLAVPFGLDYQLSRSVTLGAAGRFQVLLLNGSAIPMLGAFAKVQYVWGY